jgi:hypothetical protein
VSSPDAAMDSGTMNNPPIHVARKRSSGYQTPLRRDLHLLIKISDRRPAIGAPTVKNRVGDLEIQRSDSLRFPNPLGRKHAPMTASLVMPYRTPYTAIRLRDKYDQQLTMVYESGIRRTTSSYTRMHRREYQRTIITDEYKTRRKYLP